MMSLQSLSWSSAKPMSTINPRYSCILLRLMRKSCPCSNSVQTVSSDSDDALGAYSDRLSNYAGVSIEESVELDSGKLRLDTWISSRICGISRARVQSSIRSGLVSVNGNVVSKVSHLVRGGDTVRCSISELQPLKAEPEDIPLDIVHEDDHVLVVNKPAHMVVHPAPGNANGTLVNGILGHCQLSIPSLDPNELVEVGEDSGDEVSPYFVDQIHGGAIGIDMREAAVRPGIVHRLDKGTSGLLVIAKDERSHIHLAEQFKKHTVKRVYVSITCGVPSPTSGRIDIPVGRDVNNRIRMAAIPGSAPHRKARHAVSSRNMSSMIYTEASSGRNSLIPVSDCKSFKPAFDNHNISGIKNEETMKLNDKYVRSDPCTFPGFNGISGARAHSCIHLDLFDRLIITTTSLYQVQQLHAQLLRTGFFAFPHYNSKLLSLYARHQQISNAKSILRSLPTPNVLAFSSLITLSSKSSDYKSTLCLFSEMLSSGLNPDAHVLPSVIKACAGLSAVQIGKQAHGFSLVSGISLDPYVESSLFHFYVRCDSLFDAHKLFFNMVEKDVFSWSALTAGFARKGDVFNAKKLFDEAQSFGFEPNVVSWNGMIAGFNQSGCFQEAITMFYQMHLRGFTSDGTSISSVLPAIGDLGHLNFGTQVHGCAIKNGFSVDKCIVSALIGMYGKCGCVVEMSRVFDDMGQVDVGVCNALMAGLGRHGLVDEALGIFKELRGQGTENIVSWTSVIACCSQHGKDMEALNFFREMQVAGVRPNSVTIPCLLPACGNIAALTYGKAAHSFSIRTYISDDIYVGSALIDMYANCGKVQAARLFFERMPVRNLVCWNALLGAYSMHGKANEAIEVFRRMQRCGQKPDAITFTSLLSACSQSGLMDEGNHYFETMAKDHGIEPRVEHYACVVSLLGRAGKLEEAYSLINKMPFKPDACIWGALLSSSALHNNMSVGEIAAAKLFELEPRNQGNYILLSNIYASKRKWKEVNKVRDIMSEKGMRKNPGCSWIEVKNRVHLILAGDKSLPQMGQVLEKLRSFSLEMKKAGYLPNTNYVLQDVEEQEKEHILCGHSEKLAVVFGVLNTSPGSSLRVTKNLRICGDCHAVIKFISGFERREIFVRDTNRYHHFKDGDCSCGDYW